MTKKSLFEKLKSILKTYRQNANVCYRLKFNLANGNLCLFSLTSYEDLGDPTTFDCTISECGISPDGLPTEIRYTLFWKANNIRLRRNYVPIHPSDEPKALVDIHSYLEQFLTVEERFKIKKLLKIK